MRKLAIVTLILVPGVMLAACAPAPTKTTLHVVEHADSDTVTDTGAEGDSVGDILTFANKVFDEADATEVGSDQGYCVRTEVGKSWECFWTLFMKDGQITVEGPFNDAGDSVLAITGGTGAYANATGQMTLKAHNEAATEFDFIYEITK